MHVRKKVAAEVENIEIDFNLDEHTKTDVSLLKNSIIMKMLKF